MNRFVWMIVGSASVVTVASEVFAAPLDVAPTQAISETSRQAAGGLCLVTEAVYDAPTTWVRLAQGD